VAIVAATHNGLIDRPSNHSVEQTVERLEGLVHAKGITLFALIDHSGEAAKASMAMRPTKLLIFGSPKAGTPVMIAAPTIAIDLPLKVLVWEDDQGKVWMSYNSPDYLRDRHGVPQELLQNIAGVEALAIKAGEQHDAALVARTNALTTLPSTCGATASTSMPSVDRKARASSTS
jgi:uncharacterized protein (DUF302 family)